MTFLADTWPFPLLSFRHGGSGVGEINDWAPTGFWSLMRVPNRSRPRVITVCLWWWYGGALFGGGPYDHKFGVWRVLKGAPLMVVNVVSTMCNALRCVIRRDCIITIVLFPLNSNVLLLPIFSHSPVRLTPPTSIFCKIGSTNHERYINRSAIIT